MKNKNKIVLGTTAALVIGLLAGTYLLSGLNRSSFAKDAPFMGRGQARPEGIERVCDNQDFAAMQWAGFSTLTLEEVPTIKGSAPWHIGAYKYYKEQGLEIPEVMIPPEAK